jgi:hypothetical protein
MILVKFIEPSASFFLAKAGNEAHDRYHHGDDGEWSTDGGFEIVRLGSRDRTLIFLG